MPSVNDTPAASPIEVWLSQKNMEITCAIVYEDESTEYLDVDSLSMRGAQREITGHLLKQGYKPVGRWEAEHTGSDGYGGLAATETSRKFKTGESGS
jgi:hypothetical protein